MLTKISAALRFFSPAGQGSEVYVHCNVVEMYVHFSPLLLKIPQYFKLINFAKKRYVRNHF